MPARRVLVVDDDFFQRRFYCRRLILEGCRPIPAATALEALKSISARKPELVVADIQMPAMDGIQLLKTLRAHAATAALPVILITGMPVPQTMLAAAAKGLEHADIYAKGDHDALFARVKELLA